MRLIDGNRLVKETMPQYKELMGTDIGHGMGMMLAEINAAPTIDAVPVVRCRECQSFQADEIAAPETGTCWNCEMVRQFDDFCSYGEKRCNDAT